MKLPSRYLNKFTANILKKKEQIDSFKKIYERSDWRTMVTKSRIKLTEEYRFWIVKSDSTFKNAKLLDLDNDVKFVKSIENKDTIDTDQLNRLKSIVKKYNL